MVTDVRQTAWQKDDLRPPRAWLLALVALPLAALIAVAAFAFLQPIKVLPRIALAPGYSLVDQTGRRFTSEDLRGKLTIYNFGYTNCGAACRATEASMAAIQEMAATLDTGGLPVELVTLTVDPAHDTPERLAAYAAKIGAGASNRHFLTGDAKTLADVIDRGFNTYFGPGPAGTLVVDPVFVLVDGWGIKRAIYRSAEPELATVQRDIGLIAKEAQNSTGINRYAYEAAHLFLCYPQ